MKQWLRRWLGIEQERDERIQGISGLIAELHRTNGEICNELDTVKRELVKLQVERYTPPVEQEPEKKVRIARTSKEFRDLTEREPTESEILDALR